VGEHPPVIYILHGEDEFSISQFVAGLREKQADPTGMNFTSLDGRSLSFDALVTATSAMPFLASRRIVLLTYPLAQFEKEPARQRFLDFLEKIPSTTALVLVEYHPLTEKNARKKGYVNWLEQWAQQAGERVYISEYRLPSEKAMPGWIRERARKLGGEFSVSAAKELARLAGDDLRLVDQEIQKLLVYVNFQRPVQPDDVIVLTADYGEGDIFEMVDALGNRNGPQAIAIFHRLLGSRDADSIFHMVVRQFRMLLLGREILDQGGGKNEIINSLKLNPYAADYLSDKIMSQARRFTLPDLEAIYHRLLSIDIANKSSEMDVDLSLDLLIADLMN
jgi:DNA polymerase-3 subunit delta